MMKRSLRKNLLAARSLELVVLMGLFCLVAAAPAMAEAAGIDTELWDGYLDYAYVYASADADALRARLDQYGGEAGMSLDDYVALHQAELRGDWSMTDDDGRRRIAVASLLQYLATRETEALKRSVDASSSFQDSAGRHEQLYWFHYIQAHRALEKGNATEFSRHVLRLWNEVVVPLESPYETLQALSLGQSVNSGFVSALPYVFENICRLILIRSQEMGIRQDLDPLSGVVRMLANGRVGAHSEVIPRDASARGYLDRIISRLGGDASDGGSLTFTLALFEAGKYHDQARSLLASDGLDSRTLEAIAVSSGAYQVALNLAQTLQGQAAVYTRVLRQLGEVWAAKQRLGVDPYVELPFTIEGAVHVYQDLHASGRGDDWERQGYRRSGRDAYVATLRRLWEEIQESSLNAADYYLTRSMAERGESDALVRSAARTYDRYLSFFRQYADVEGAELVPDAAYFAAYEAAKGYGDSFLVYGAVNPSAAEVDVAVERYMMALGLFPFDRNLWPALVSALERQGRSNQFLSRAGPIAVASARSRHVDAWISAQEPGSQELAVMRRALSDELAVMYLGFADGADLAQLEASVSDLQQRRRDAQRELSLLERSRDAPPAARAEGSARGESPVERAERNRQIAEAKSLVGRLDKQLAARTRALPLFEATLSTGDLIQQLRSQRNHPVHTLLRRMYYETRS
jgi:hypothetical protein